LDAVHTESALQVIPMGGVIVTDEIYNTCVNIDSPAVGLAAFDIYKEEGLFERARELAPVLENAAHSLKGTLGVIDIRSVGLAAAVDLDPVPGMPGLRAFRAFEHGFANGHLFRVTGDTVAMAPPFISSSTEIE